MPYKGNTYNIPVNIWIHSDYPTQAPIVLVTPTKDMQIKPSKIVDGNGRVYLPYLHEWKARQVRYCGHLLNIKITYYFDLLLSVQENIVT